MIRQFLLLALLAAPAHADGPNLSSVQQVSSGSAARLVEAQRAYDLALTTGEVVPLLEAIRIARGVTLRPATGWEKATTGKALADAPEGRTAAPDPASDAALTIAQGLAGEDPALQDLVFDLDAQVPRGFSRTAVEARSDLSPGQTDDWRLPLFGEVAAEIAVIGDGDGPLQVSVRDDGGTTVCAGTTSTDPILCRLTPARNGFFTVTIGNPGSTVNSYRLIGN